MKKGRDYSDIFGGAAAAGIIIIILLMALFGEKCQGQSFGVSLSTNPCGTWVTDTLITTEWKTIDTLGTVQGKFRVWAYDEWEYKTSNITPAVYCPCGCGYPTIWTQKRICVNSGIRQSREKKRMYRYVPPPESDYDKAIKKFYKLQTSGTLRLGGTAYLDNTTILTDSLTWIK